MIKGLAGTLLAALAFAAPAAAQQELTIYSSLPLAGDSRPQTQSMVNAMKLALDDVGGMAGAYKIAYISLNDATAAAGKWDPEQVFINARLAARDDTTVAYIGEFNSGASAISMPILNEAGILQISPSNTYAGLTRREQADRGEPARYFPTGRRTYGRVAPADHRQADALVTWLRQSKVKRLFLADDGEVYGGGMTAMLKRRAAKAGIRIVGQVRGRSDPRTYVSALSHPGVVRGVKRTKADAFFFGGITQNRAVALYDRVHRARRSTLLFGPDGIAESGFTERIARGTRAKMRITNPTLDPRLYPASAQDFFQRFEARFGKVAEPYAIYAYEAMRLALDCVAKGGADRRAVVDAFFATRGRDGVLGRYSIDRNGDTTLSTYGANRVTRSGVLVFDRVLNLAG